MIVSIPYCMDNKEKEISSATEGSTTPGNSKLGSTHNWVQAHYSRIYQMMKIQGTRCHKLAMKLCT